MFYATSSLNVMLRKTSTFLVIFFVIVICIIMLIRLVLCIIDILLMVQIHIFLREHLSEKENQVVQGVYLPHLPF